MGKMKQFPFLYEGTVASRLFGSPRQNLPHYITKSSARP